MTHLRTTIRNGLVLAAIVVASPVWLWSRTATWWTGRDTVYLGCAQLMSVFPGRIGVYLRRGFYAMVLDECAWDIEVEFGSWFSHPTATVRSGAYIGARCIIGSAVIEENCLIGSNVDILSGRRQHGNATDQPMASQVGRYEQVVIGPNCWIGNQAVVMADVGEGAIVGAGSVVPRAVGSFAVVAGNPAQTLRRRGGPPNCDERDMTPDDDVFSENVSHHRS